MSAPVAAEWIAPPQRARVADGDDNVMSLSTTAFCIFGEAMMPALSRSRSLAEMMFPLVLGVTLICGFSLFHSGFELSGGTIGQRLAGVRRVRPDGSPMRAGDWLYRHWPSILCILLILALWCIAAAEPRFATTRLAIEWLTSRMLMLSVPCGLLIIGGYLLRTLRPTTIVIVRQPERRRGFEVLVANRSAGDAERS